MPSVTDSKGYKIAIVEDERAIRELYQHKLELSGFEVRTAEDGPTGLELLETFQPQLMLLDIRMPHMNGDEVLAKVREQEWGGAIRTIILTNMNKEEAPSSLRFLGVDRYIVKAHYTPAQVLEIVYEVLHLKPVR